MYRVGKAAHIMLKTLTRERQQVLSQTCLVNHVTIPCASLCSCNTGYDIKGKFALVTGASTGIGYECVKHLLCNGLQGVTIADVDEKNGKKAIDELTKQFGCNRAAFCKTDVTKADQLEATFKATKEMWKNIDIVINNAGILRDSVWEKEIAINCNAVVRGTLLAFKYMGKDKCGKGGVVVNVSSILGLAPLSGSPVYVGTKHFVIGFDRSIGSSYHFQRTGVKVLTMCPGVTDTSLVSDANKHAIKEIIPGIEDQIKKERGSLPAQPTENVAKGMVTLITQGESGSVWVCEGNEPIYEVQIPDRLTLRKC